MDKWEEENPSPEEPQPLNRESMLQTPAMKQKKFGIFGFILMGVAAIVLLFFFNGKEKPKDGLQKESVEFEPAAKRIVTVPEVPIAPIIKDRGPSEADLAKAAQEEAMRQARLKSAILVYGSHSDKTANGVEANKPEASGIQTGNSNPNSRFQEGLSSSTTPNAKASSLNNLNQTILQGKLIDGVLETAIHSDLPGMIRAMVSHDVYAETGDEVLIPKGSRLVGQYNSELVKGQSRIFVVWNRLVRPDGIEIALGSGGTDPLGRAGLTGHVNNHFWKIFGNSLLLSIIGAGTANGGVSPTDQYNSVAAYRQQASQAFQSSAGQVLQNSINIPPTITIKQGVLIKVLVARDLDFSEALGSSNSSGMVMLP